VSEASKDVICFYVWEKKKAEITVNLKSNSGIDF
jgi:hypothetical protein